MTLTKAQVSLVTVATLGAAPGGFTADLLNFGSQVEVAALALSVSPTQAAQTNAEFVNQVVKNLGTVAAPKDKIAFLKALEAGTSRAEAAVDFANAQLVAQGGNIASVNAAAASTSTSTDLNELTKVVSGTDSALTVKFEDGHTTDDYGNSTPTVQTKANLGKDAGQQGKISADFTFALKNQIGEADTFNGLFLSPIIDRQAASSTGSQLFLELLDLRAQKDDKAALERVPVDTFAFGLNGSQILVQSEAIFAAKTYPELFAAIQARVEELGNGVNVPTTDSNGNPADAAAYAKLAGFTVELGSNFTVKNQKGDDVSGTQIVLKDSGGAILTPQGFVNKAGVIPDPGYTLYAQLNNVEPTQVTKLITTNLDADNVGYGSQGASVNLAGQSASNKGVEEIKVLATKGVWFTKLESKATTNHLQRVELKSGSEGYFRVGTQENSLNHVVSLVDQDFSKGGLVDVQQVEASAAGETAINSYISENVLGRYDFKDTGVYTADDSKAAITYNLSSGADILNLAISTKVLAAVDTQVNVNTGAGDDVITVMATNGLIANKATAAISGTGWLINQQLNDNIKIDAGAGNDWILTPGAGNATILAGSGDDVVRVDNTGDRGVFVFNNATTDINKLKLNQGLDSNSDNGLSSGANGSPQTFDFYKAVVKVTFKGFESKYITIDSTNNYTTTTKQINQAIKKAINDDAVLSKLIAAHDNEGNALAIESLIDGLLTIGELDISIIPPVTYNATETAAAKTAREEAGQLMLNNGEEAKADAAYLADGKSSTTAGIDTTAANTAYDTQFGTSSTGANPFGAVPAVAESATFVAGDAGTLTFDLTAAATATKGSGNVDVGGHTVAVSSTDTANDIAGKIYAVLNGLAATATVNFTGLGAIPVSQLTFTDPAAGNNLVIGVSAAWILDNSATLASSHIPVINDNAATDFSIVSLDVTAAAPTAAIAEEQTLTFVDAVNAGTVTVAGYDVAITAGMAKEAIAAAVHTAINGNNDENGVVLTSTDNSDGTLTIEYPAVAGNVAPITVSQAGVGVNHEGGNSFAESDNVIDLGAGQDVLTLGTGTLSNDTVLVKEYNLGHKTIVNFTQNTGTAADGTNGEDLLDFTSYLTNVDANGARVATSVGTMSGAANGNAVEIVDYLSTEKLTTASTAVITFENLTAGDVKAMINNDDSASGLLNIDLDASGAASLTQNYVLMVHNKHATAGNEGEYKAFHVTSKGNSDEAATVQLIGTFDFGDVAGTSVLNGIDETNFA